MSINTMSMALVSCALRQLQASSGARVRMLFRRLGFLAKLPLFKKIAQLTTTQNQQKNDGSFAAKRAFFHKNPGEKGLVATSSFFNSPFVIFLDIDGVVYNKPNQEGVFKKAAELFPSGKERHSNRACSIAASYFFNKEALKNLDNLIGEIEQIADVWVVISSSWRTGTSIEELSETFFGIHNFSKYIVDKTPEKMSEEEIVSLCPKKSHSKTYSSRCRAAEIQCWLEQHPEVLDYVILDDEDDHLSGFGERFIQTEYRTLLTKEMVEKFLASRLK